MLVDKIRSLMQDATKSGDLLQAQTLKMLMAALEYKRGQRMADFNEADELAVVRSEVKKRQEAAEIYEKSGNNDRAAQEKKELEILQQFVPQMASEEEIRKVVMELKESMPNKGQLIGAVMARMGKDKVDGAIVSRVVNEVM